MRWLLGLALALLAACGGSNAVPDAPFGDGFVGPGPDTQLCGTICAGQCVDLATDPMHCGICTRECTSDLPACVNGTCAVSDQTLVALHFGGAAVAAVATDAAGNLFMTGSFTGTIDLGGGPLTSAGGADIFVASYTSTGAHRWSKAYGGAGDDGGAAIATGNGVLIAGHLSGSVTFDGTMLVSTGGTDVFELELDPDSGDRVIAQSWGTANDDAAYAIAAFQGQVAIAGAVGAGGLDFGVGSINTTALATGFVAVFDAGGNNLWAQRVDGTAPPYASAARAVAFDPNNDVIVAGEFSGIGEFPVGVTAAGTDAFVTSYTSFGMMSWARTFGGPQADIANAVVVDIAGNIVVGGSYQGSVDFGAGAIPSIGVPDGFLAGYAASGQFQFARHLGAVTSSSVTGVAVTATGGILATGTLEGAADLGTGPLVPLGKTDIFIAGFGGVAPTFAKRFGGADLDAGAAIAAGPGVYATACGRFRGTADLGTGSIAGDAGDNGYLVVIAP